MYEILIGMHVGNEELYGKYRAAMLPILKQHGGDFGYDFRVSDALINPSGHAINRVFTIQFPDQDTADKVFADSEYVVAKAKFFDRAVVDWTTIAEYTR